MLLPAIADRLTQDLRLDQPPVGLAFVDEPPVGVATAADPVPSACAFWRQAEREILFAPADAHFNCPIGAFVMDFDLPAEVETALGELIGQIVENGYIGPEEPAKLPRRRVPRRGILYGPLASFPIRPDAILLWLTPAQAMIWNEASGGAAWGGGSPATAFGRPACAAIPAALDGAQPVLSLGCTGMRTFTEIGTDRLLAVAPGARIAEAVHAATDLNTRMRDYYEGRRMAVIGQVPQTPP